MKPGAPAAPKDKALAVELRERLRHAAAGADCAAAPGDAAARRRRSRDGEPLAG